MPWHAELALDYTHEAGRSVARFLHKGPLRVLHSLYPEGDAICHNVLVHPPAGLVGGDTLALTVQVAAGAHGLVTTPGATRFYRSEGAPALQHTRLQLAAGARFEWLPLETLCYSGCIAENRLELALAPGAECMGWDVTALGLPGAGQPFADGSLLLHTELPGVWLERGHVRARDTRLLHSPLGLAGRHCMATLFFAAGSPLARNRRDAALDCARQVLAGNALETTAGATSPNPQVVVVRVLAPMVEPAMMAVLRPVWQAWRAHFWGLQAPLPRTWKL